MAITKKKLINHLRYTFGIYIMIVVLSVFIWDIIYSATAYRAPEDKKIEWYIGGNPAADSKKLDTFMAETRNSIMPDMEEMAAVILLDAGMQDTYSDMQLTTFIISEQGDVYLLTKDKFLSYGRAGAFLPLDDYIKNGQINIGGMDTKRGVLTVPATANEPAATHTYGIPASSLKGLIEYGINPDDMYLSILYNNKNDDNSVKFLNHILNTMK